MRLFYKVLSLLVLPVLFIGIGSLQVQQLTGAEIFAAAPIQEVTVNEVASPSVVPQNVEAEIEPLAPAAACTGSGPTVPGPLTLDQCYGHSFTVDGNGRTVSVWYTTDTTAYTVDSKTYNHWVASESQAIAVAEAAEDAWQRYYTDSGHEPYLNGCNDNLNIQLEDGKGWAGIAYWGVPGKCNIGIDSPMILGGVGDNDERVIAHEVGHYLQYSYDDGCYNDFRPLYPGDSEYVEGYADIHMNSVDGLDSTFNMMGSYSHSSSMYDKSYGNSFLAYFTQQLGTTGAPADSNFHIDPVYAHYRECDLQDDLYVIDDVIGNLSSGAHDQETFFLDFFAANYAHSYADADTQPALVYADVDDVPTSGPSYAQSIDLATGSQSWTESTPDDWAATYYRVRPQTGCDYVQLHVETQPAGGKIGINFLAAKTSGTTEVLRSALIGDEGTRFFAGAGSFDELVVVVNSFNTASTTYRVDVTCVAPTLNILEPLHNPGHAMVGAPNSPIATLTRFEVSSSGLPVSGIPEDAFTFDAGADAATVVAGSISEIGPGEYWGVIIPPVKPAGTTFVDYRVCLDTTICDSESDALLYVDPGNVDTALVIDESGSMATQDTTGEGTRVDNAKKAAGVVADLLLDGDRVLVLGFGAKDDPLGCGLPPDGTGTGNCPPDNATHQARTDVTIPATIAATKAAIGGVTARPVWTNIGQGLIDAKNMLLANPGNTNPDFIYLLSDGRENVNPLYSDARSELQLSGVHINTIGFGPEAPGALLAQIAADNGGTYRPVPTSGLGTGLVSAAAINASPFLPGQLGLADVYDDFDARSQGASRVFHAAHISVPPQVTREEFAVVDKAATSFQFVVAAKQPDGQGIRIVEILPPNEDPDGRWIPISPAGAPSAPVEWDIRNGTYEDVLIVPSPEPGRWGFRVRHLELPADFIMNLSVQSTVRLHGRLLNLTSGQGKAGDVVPVIAFVITRNGLLKEVDMTAVVENEGGTDVIQLYDDGNHDDGIANDGIYGWSYAQTEHGGSYAVRIIANFPDPDDPSTKTSREWNGGFWIDGPQEEDEEYDGDTDQDGMPDDWEKRCELDVGRNDAEEDPDRDGLINIRELAEGTLPCKPDTDLGGELDGSEVRAKRNPLWPDDDFVLSIGHIELRPLKERIWIQWNKPFSYTTMRLYVSTVPEELGEVINIGRDGEYMLEGLQNGDTYYLTLQGTNEDADGAYSTTYAVIPKEDPIPPQGAFLVDGPTVTGGGDVATSREVILYAEATDVVDEYLGPASHSIAHDLVVPHLSAYYGAEAGEVQMRFANAAEALAEAEWEALAAEKPWILDCEDGEMCSVFGQFKDAAENESLIVTQQIRLEIPEDFPIYLPIIQS